MRNIEATPVASVAPAVFAAGGLTLTLLLLAAPCLAADNTAQLDDLYQSNRWFEFRDAMARTANPPAFYKGELALAFHDWPEAEKQLSSAMKQRQDVAHAFEAALGLLEIYDLSGRSKDARALLPKMQRLLQSGSVVSAARKQFETVRAQLAALEGYPDQSIAARGQSRLMYQMADNELVIPLTVNGAPSNYMIDTGSDLSSVSESEAKRLGLEIHRAKIELSTYGTYREEAIGIAVAPDVTLGNFHIRNVRFVVTANQVVDDVPGIIGLPVLLAIGTIRWNSDGTMEFGFPSAARNLGQSNLCLVDSNLLAQVRGNERDLTAVLDTGSFDSDLLPAFGKLFPDLLAARASDDPDAAVIPDQTFRFGGLDTDLSPAHLLLRDPVEDSLNVQVWLGMDLLAQARSITFDFGAMRATLDGIDRGASAPAGQCALPPDFLCPSGWQCQVKTDDRQFCAIDRIPAEPWPGNAIAAGYWGGAHCRLAENAACGAGHTCRVTFDGANQCKIETAVPPVVKPSTLRPSSPAPATKSDPNARSLVERAFKFDSLDLAPARNYVYLEDKVEKLLNADGSVSRTASETREVMNLYDGEFERLIKKNGKPLPPDKARAEQAKFDKAVEKRAHETPEQKARRLAAERKSDAAGAACDSEFLTMFDFHLAGSEELEGRATWIVALDPLPGADPHCGDIKVLTRFRMKIWVDEAEFRLHKLEGDNIAPVTWARFLLRLPTGGAHIVFEQSRHNDGAWLASNLQVRANAKVLLFAPVRQDLQFTYSNYRKFQSDSKVLPVDGGK